MKRRELLSVGSAGCLCCLSGCTAFDPTSLGFGGDGHPFADSTVAVRIENQGTTDRDIETNAREALDFWAAESSQYVDFEVDFEIVTDDPPDMIMAYVDSPEACRDVEEYTSDVLGCAPLIRPENRIERPVTAHIVAADRPLGSVRTTAQHEIGHLLGLGHKDDPPEIMSNRPEDRIPRYEIRTEIWETAIAAHEEAAAAVDRLNEGINDWSEEAYETATETCETAATTFAAAQAEFETARERSADLEAEPPLETVDLPMLTEDLDQRIERMALGGDTAETIQEAAEAAAADNRQATRERVSAANDQLTEFRELEPTPLRTVASALGLVRGFDREDREETVDGF